MERAKDQILLFFNIYKGRCEKFEVVTYPSSKAEGCQWACVCLFVCSLTSLKRLTLGDDLSLVADRLSLEFLPDSTNCSPKDREKKATNISDNTHC